MENNSIASELKKLFDLLETGAITKDEYDKLKAEVLESDDSKTTTASNKPKSVLKRSKIGLIATSIIVLSIVLYVVLSKGQNEKIFTNISETNFRGNVKEFAQKTTFQFDMWGNEDTSVEFNKYYLFNDDGLLIADINSMYSYDEKGNLTEVVIDDGRRKITYAYDSRGRLIEEKNIGRFGIIHAFEFKHDENGDIIEQYLISPRGRNLYMSYKYNSSGNLIDSTYYSSYHNWNRDYSIRYEYDEQGRLIDEWYLDYNSNGTKIESESGTKYQYNRKGYLIESRDLVRLADGSYETIGFTTNKYNRKGYLIESRTVEIFEDYGYETETLTTFKYNRRGDVIQIAYSDYSRDEEKFLHRGTSRYEYEYDKKGNWIKKTSFRTRLTDGKEELFLVEERDIQYL
jgi:YD repeat-containing protein